MRRAGLLPLALLAVAAVSALPQRAGAQPPFADAVLRYDPLHGGGPAPGLPYQDAGNAIGAPDGGYVSLGRGGLIELAFTDNLLTNSASAAADLYIYEIGPDVEDTFVAIRPLPSTSALLGAGFDLDGDGFFEIGKVFGATSTLDLDALFPGFAAGVLRFDAVQLIDDPNEGDRSGVTVGADINAVEALTSIPAESTVPEPGTLALLAGGLAGLLGVAHRRRAARA